MTANDLVAWLKAGGLDDLDLAYSTEGQIPSTPDRLVVVTGAGGPGETRERTYDLRAFQIITRGGQDGSVSAEALTSAVDDALMGARPPLSINGSHVIRIQRLSGPPAFLDRDEARRVLNVCVYQLEVARTVF